MIKKFNNTARKTLKYMKIKIDSYLKKYDLKHYNFQFFISHLIVAKNHGKLI